MDLVWPDTYRTKAAMNAVCLMNETCLGTFSSSHRTEIGTLPPPKGVGKVGF